MPVYSVMQLKITNEEREKLNATLARGDIYPAWYQTRLDIMFSPTADAIYDAWHLYEESAHITAKDCDEVFEIGNVGPEECIERKGQMHSISVGDVIVDTNCNSAWFVDNCGFGDLGTVYPNPVSDNV